LGFVAVAIQARDGGAALGLGFGAPPTCPPSAIINPNCKSKAQATILCWLTVMPRLLHVSSVSSGEHKPSPRVLLLVCVCVCEFFFLGVLLFLGLSERERLQTHHYVSLLLLLLLLLAGFLFWLTFVVHEFELLSFLFFSVS
jgi:heme/copper-type cytochrome/quinol oxidase subunit 4